MSPADPLLDPTGRVEPVQKAIAGGRSLWDDARARLLRNKAAVISMWVLGVMVLIALIGPMVWVHDYRTISDARAIAPTCSGRPIQSISLLISIASWARRSSSSTAISTPIRAGCSRC